MNSDVDVGRSADAVVDGALGDDFLTVPEAAALLRINPKTAYRLALARELPGAFRVGGQWRVSREQLLRSGQGNGVASSRERR